MTDFCFQTSACTLYFFFRNGPAPRIVVGQPAVPEAVQPVLATAPAAGVTPAPIPLQTLGRVGRVLARVDDVLHVADFSNK